MNVSAYEETTENESNFHGKQSMPAKFGIRGPLTVLLHPEKQQQCSTFATFGKIYNVA